MTSASEESEDNKTQNPNRADRRKGGVTWTRKNSPKQSG